MIDSILRIGNGMHIGICQSLNDSLFKSQIADLAECARIPSDAEPPSVHDWPRRPPTRDIMPHITREWGGSRHCGAYPQVGVCTYKGSLTLSFKWRFKVPR